jgi:hypothetical protein
MKNFLRRFTDRNKLSYFMNIAFGLSFLLEILYWQFGKTTLHVDSFSYTLTSGYITESHLWIRIVEGIIALGLISLGIERLINRKKNNNENK